MEAFYLFSLCNEYKFIYLLSFNKSVAIFRYQPFWHFYVIATSVTIYGACQLDSTLVVYTKRVRPCFNSMATVAYITKRSLMFG